MGNQDEPDDTTRMIQEVVMKSGVHIATCNCGVGELNGIWAHHKETCPTYIQGERIREELNKSL